MKNGRGLLIGIIFLVVIIIAGIFLFFSYSPNLINSTNPTNGEKDDTLISDSGAKRIQILISDFRFMPNVLSINKGDTVIWKNEDSVTHTVTSDSGTELDSDILKSGQSYEHTFDSSGTYDYHCSLHLGMKAKIIVS